MRKIDTSSFCTDFYVRVQGLPSIFYYTDMGVLSLKVGFFQNTHTSIDSTFSSLLKPIITKNNSR